MHIYVLDRAKYILDSAAPIYSTLHQYITSVISLLTENNCKYFPSSNSPEYA